MTKNDRWSRSQLLHPLPLAAIVKLGQWSEVSSLGTIHYAVQSDPGRKTAEV